MRVIGRILAGLGLLILVGLLALVIALRRDAPCGAAAPPADGALMTAVVHRCYGPPGVLRIEQVARPVPAEDEVLVRVHAVSLNPLDFHYLRGTPYVVRLESGFGKPTDVRLGVDFAGTVESVGRRVTQFKPGDEVFGGHTGAFAQYVTVKAARALTLKPSDASFAEAAALPIAAVTALQGLRDAGRIRAGQRVLVNGASGGVGTYAVQIAKSYGAEVTGVCSARNAALVSSLGADHVIDYATTDFTREATRYDLILDTVSTHSLADYRRVLTPAGRVVIVGNAHLGNWLSPFWTPVKALVLSKFTRQQFVPVLAELRKDDLAELANLMQAHQLKSVIDRTLPFAELPQGLAYVEAGHARGKVVVEVP